MIHILANGKIIKYMDMVFIYGQMATNMMVTFR